MTEKFVVECPNCNALISTIEAKVPVRTYKRRALCKKCLEEFYFECPEKGRHVFDRNMVHGNTSRVICFQDSPEYVQDVSD